MWAVESAGGLGKLLSQELLAAGEHVVDVPPTLSARVRLLGSAKAAKNDGNDALSTAIAGLRHCGLRMVRGDDHSTVLSSRSPRSPTTPPDASTTNANSSRAKPTRKRSGH